MRIFCRPFCHSICDVIENSTLKIFRSVILSITLNKNNFSFSCQIPNSPSLSRCFEGFSPLIVGLSRRLMHRWKIIRSYSLVYIWIIIRAVIIWVKWWLIIIWLGTEIIVKSLTTLTIPSSWQFFIKIWYSTVNLILCQLISVDWTASRKSHTDHNEKTTPFPRHHFSWWIQFKSTTILYDFFSRLLFRQKTSLFSIASALLNYFTMYN